jgi:hypothetical protein
VTITTILFFTDAITALVRAAEPLRVAIEDAKERGDRELRTYLLLTYNPLVFKLNDCISKAWREWEWTARELCDEDAKTLERIVRSESYPAGERRQA